MAVHGFRFRAPPLGWLGLFLVVLAVAAGAAAIAWVRLSEAGAARWPVAIGYALLLLPIAATATLPRCWGCVHTDTVLQWFHPVWWASALYPVQGVLAVPWLVAGGALAARRPAIAREAMLCALVGLGAATGLVVLWDFPTT